ERREETEWFTVVAFSRLAERCDQILTKGQRVYVEGRLQTRTWQTPDGQLRKGLEVLASDVIFLGPRRTDARPDEPMAAAHADDFEIEDLPF
ncbi:MAG: single-stranded DNA-binding protein, partial [Dehalococcoidia bacterium]|nr:single-stranded DNA-binding protein [Dehalococcoidia bacterium]